MEILRKSGELSTEEQYKLCMSKDAQKMSILEEQVVELGSWLLYKDVNSKGEEQKILAVKTPVGEVFATNSPTFVTDFERTIDFFEQNNEVVQSVKVVGGTSKNGRHYITCEYNS